jgi:hypothetical protein
MCHVHHGGGEQGPLLLLTGHHNIDVDTHKMYNTDRIGTWIVGVLLYDQMLLTILFICKVRRSSGTINTSKSSVGRGNIDVTLFQSPHFT